MALFHKISEISIHQSYGQYSHMVSIYIGYGKKWSNTHLSCSYHQSEKKK